ncbi:unnamed protein product [Penicillium pancosmium]
MSYSSGYLANASVLAFITLLYATGLVFYRLFLSPLAKFPGPRLAAATEFYEIYHQIIKGGTFTWHIDRLHEQYGPVVRITPFEIHIKDPDYYSTVYAGPGKHRNKDPDFSFIGFPGAIFSTDGYELHRARRKVMGQFFKKNAIQEFEPIIRANVEALCQYFSMAAVKMRPLEVHAPFYSFTSDTVSQHAFGRQAGLHSLNEYEPSATWKNRLTSMFSFCLINRHFPLLNPLAHMFPSLAAWAVPAFGYILDFENDVRKMVGVALNDHWQIQHSEKVLPQAEIPQIVRSRSMYPNILADSEIPQSEKELTRLEDDAIFLMMAGTDAPAQAIAITLFHVLNNPNVYDRLKEELFTIPDSNKVPTLEQFQHLPYLTATIREGLRLSSVVTTRLPRSAPNEILQYQDWQIPAGTYVSMSTFFILRDPKIFPQPLEFLPERWLLSPDDLRKQEKYLVPASKGTLGCVGQNMAWAMMHLVLGTLLRRYSLELYDTTERNVEMKRDNFIGQTGNGLNNIQVKVLEEYRY